MSIPEFKFALREDLKNNSEFLPTKGEPYATGWDVRAAQNDRQDLVIQPGHYFKIPLGFRCIPTEGYWYKLHPRSSSVLKKNIQALIGIIDEHFPLEACFVGLYLPDVSNQVPLTLKFGEAIGQIIPVKRQEMEVSSISNEEFDRLCKQRNAVRNGGFGSTHK